MRSNKQNPQLRIRPKDLLPRRTEGKPPDNNSVSNQLRLQQRYVLGEFIGYLIYFEIFYNSQLLNGAVLVIDTSE